MWLCAIELSILIDSLTPCRNIFGGWATTFTCNVEAELQEIEIESIDGTREVEGSRRMHYYND